jgi:hypothetical protein
MQKLPHRSLFVSAYYALCYGIGATSASFALVGESSLPLHAFFFALLGVNALVGFVAAVLLWRTTLPPKSVHESSKLLVQAADQNDPPSVGETFLIFVKSPLSWLVVVILLLNIGVGSTYAANMERYVASQDDDNLVNLALLVAFFNLAQTVGRLVAVLVGARGDLTLAVVASVSVGFVVLLSLASTLQNGAFYISLSFGIFYGAMRSAISSILFNSSIRDRKQFVSLALFTFPVAGLGPLGLNFLVGFLFERDGGSFQWAFILLAVASGISGILTVILFILQPKLPKPDVQS